MWIVLGMMVACGGGVGTGVGASSGTEDHALRSDMSLEAFAAVYSATSRLIDVRTPEEFASGRVPRAIHVPMADLSTAHPAIASHPKTEPLYLICHSGGRSAMAAETLAAAGFQTVNVLGGTEEWISSGRDVER